MTNHGSMHQVAVSAHAVQPPAPTTTTTTPRPPTRPPHKILLLTEDTKFESLKLQQLLSPFYHWMVGTSRLTRTRYPFSCLEYGLNCDSIFNVWATNFLYLCCSAHDANRQMLHSIPQSHKTLEKTVLHTTPHTAPYFARKSGGGSCCITASHGRSTATSVRSPEHPKNSKG